MARKQTIKELREEAKKLLEKAKQLEETNIIELGKAALSLSKKGHLQAELQTIVDKLFK